MILSAFKTYVLQDFKRTDKDTELIQAYNDSIVYVAVLMPHGGYKYQSYVPTVVAQPNYPLPNDLIHLIHPIRLLEGSGTNDSGYPLDHITKQEYDVIEPNPNRANPSTGKPQEYCIFSRAILPTPIPDLSTYLLEIDWSKRPVVLSGNNDLHSLGSEWDEVLKWMTLTRLNAGIELFQEAQYWETKYQDSEGNPIGMLKRLLDIERDREYKAIGQIENNNL
jgi:hypothetical protein